MMLKAFFVFFLQMTEALADNNTVYLDALHCDSTYIVHTVQEAWRD